MGRLCDGSKKEDPQDSDAGQIECWDSETGKRYILCAKTGQVVREVKPNE